MNMKKFIFAILLPAVALTGLFTFTQTLKGATMDNAFQFGVEWAVITLGIYYGVRALYRYRGKACKVESKI
ncbi:MAG: hypothetical protein EOO52_15100 [Gammaproteobacteria bacterium]|nr:MAG: hypothetical protein EOO52_15100 [Gammaproteobacteria bacterium]